MYKGFSAPWLRHPVEKCSRRYPNSKTTDSQVYSKTPEQKKTLAVEGTVNYVPSQLHRIENFLHYFLTAK